MIVGLTRSLALIFVLLLGVSASVATSCDGAETQSGATPYLREFGYFTTTAGIRLAYVAYRPRNVARAPVVFTYDPYLGGGGDPEPLFLDAGYAYVAMSVAGTGCSQGRLGFMHGDEIGQGVEAVAWLARRRWSNGRVAMWGYSYPAHTAMLIAAQNPPALKAIAVGSLTTDWYWDNAYPGGIPNVGIMAHWANDMQPRLEAIGVEHRKAWGDVACAATIAARPENGLFETMLSHPTDDTWWRDIALGRRVKNIKAPVLMTHNWQDQLTLSGDRLFDTLTAPKRILLMPGGHSYAQVQPEVQATTIRWFDRWVRGVPNGADKAPTASVLWEVERSGPRPTWKPRWTTDYASWPVAQVEHKSLVLSASGSLDSAQVAGATGVRRYVYPLGTEISTDGARFKTPPDPLGALSYITPPLAADLTILGEPRLSLRISSDRADTDIMIVLHDIYPDGSTQHLRSRLHASVRGIGTAVREGHATDLGRHLAVAWSRDPARAPARTSDHVAAGRIKRRLGRSRWSMRRGMWASQVKRPPRPFSISPWSRPSPTCRPSRPAAHRPSSPAEKQLDVETRRSLRGTIAA